MVSAEVVPSANDFASAASPLSVPHGKRPPPTIRARRNHERSESPPAHTAVVFACLNWSGEAFLAANSSHAPFKAAAARASWQKVINAKPIQLAAGDIVSDGTAPICCRIAGMLPRFCTAYISAVTPISDTSRLLNTLI